MKKVLAIVIMLVMVIGLVPFSVSAEAPLGSANYQKALEGTNLDGWQLATQYYTGEKRTMPMAGARFTSEGLQLISPKYTEKGHSSLVTWDMIDISEGGSVTIKINEFPDFNVTDDAWLSFSLLTEPVAAQGSNNQQGMVTLLRGYVDNNDDGNADVVPTALFNLAMPSNKPPFMGIGYINLGGVGIDESRVIDIARPGETITFEWGMDADGQYRFAFNSFNTTDRRATPTDWVDAAFKRIPAQFENHKAYLMITVYSASTSPMSFTITDFNGKKPSGTVSVEPEKEVGDAIVDVPPAHIPEGQPGLLWSPDTCSSNPDVEYADMTVTEDGWHLTATGPQPSLTFRPGNIGFISTDAAEFPILAFKVRRKVIDVTDNDWPRVFFGSGKTYGYSNTEQTSEGIYGLNEWNLITVDLSEHVENGRWKGKVNVIRVVLGEEEIDSTRGLYEDLTGNEYELAWVGIFRTEEDAFKYGGVEGDDPVVTDPGTTGGGNPGGETTDPAESGEPKTEEPDPGTEEEPGPDVEPGIVGTTPATEDPGEATTPATGDSTETAAGETATGGTTDAKKDGGFPVWAIILIVAVVVLAGGGCALFFILKKKKTV